MSIRLAVACRCGATLTGDADSTALFDLAKMFWELHKGPRHGEVTFEQARNARRRAERKLRRERAS